MNGESREVRLKRMRMRAWHRGTKEMDLILGRFIDDRLGGMDAATLDLLDALMEENDQDLYQWVTGQCPAPARFSALVAQVAAHAGVR
ncbi:antitoxin CptB [Rhodovulum imhoffii]|uniref:FAD assembly factor SdhE n=1 Tax=Rhodovulum imhoffii TaxID=365340 RepID=A0A2T5BW85_9RHOB|nr:succinate dehydrogenase assembly factor 2 [Rhodovulum imhoffii]MBK5935136.1 succinate dehydrogenase assembly factor 2 [Rhodovulum imhoffii]PTN03897.1 antitoxin CptB [Rhodovulum imhoffii]